MSSSIKLLSGDFGHVINGKLDAAPNAKRLDVNNPATGEHLASVPICDRATLDKAVEAAAAAFPAWRDKSWAERAAAVKKWGEHYQSSIPDLIPLLTAEQGKALGISHYEANAVTEWFEAMPSMELKETTVLDDEKMKAITRYTPLGVCAGIVPWNFPILLMVWKIIPAVLTGNTIIIKPSPFTPLCDIRIVEAAQQFFPPGVIQVVVGDDTLGPWITEHEGIRKVSFTGSSATGRLVAKSCSATLKRFTLELGGKDPCVVMSDVDFEKAIPQIFMAATLNSGQTCVCAKRIYVHDSIYDKFSQALAGAFQNGAVVGDPLKEGVLIGPINNKMQHKKVSEFFDDVKSKGYKTFAGGDITSSGDGLFATPTLVDNPPDDSKIAVEEPFGPIVPLFRYKDEAELLKRINSSEYGLGASVWSTDLEKANAFARKIDSGIVWVNSSPVLHPRVPFGGCKSSGIGCENGDQGLQGWCQLHSICVAK